MPRADGTSGEIKTAVAEEAAIRTPRGCAAGVRPCSGRCLCTGASSVIGSARADSLGRQRIAADEMQVSAHPRTRTGGFQTRHGKLEERAGIAVGFAQAVSSTSTLHGGGGGQIHQL